MVMMRQQMIAQPANGNFTMQPPVLANLQNQYWRSALVILICILISCFSFSANAQSTSRAQTPPDSQSPSNGALQPLSSGSEAAGGGGGSGRRQAALQNSETESRFQGAFPSELILPPPSNAARQRASRFIESEVDPELPLSLVIGRPKILQLAAAPRRIYVPDDQTIRAELIDQQSGRELAVTGLELGTTTLMLWFDDPQAKNGQSIVSYLVRVYEDPVLKQPLETITEMINTKFPDSFIELSDVNGRLLVSGEARDATEMAQILQVLIGVRGVAAGVRTVTPSTTIGSVTNFSTNQDLDLQRQEAENRSLIDPVALAQAGIVNLIRVPGEQQVMLRVTVAEVNRTAARSLGLDFTALGSNNVFSNTTGGVAGNLSALLDGGDLDIKIEALRQLSLSRTLAEPNLVTINGQTASFQAGGQFPIPVLSSGGAGGDNLQGVQFIPFGVQLQFTPTIQDRDVIRLQLNADVSTRDESVGTTVGGAGGGTAVSGLDSRNFSSTVELRSGQTLAVAGLLQTNFGSSSSRVPFLGDLPLIGPLTGSNGTSAAEQELVILVTPELVSPKDLRQVVRLPGDNVYEPTDVEFFLSNRLESRRSKDFRSPVRTDFVKQQLPDRCCPDQFIIGSSGPTDRVRPFHQTGVEISGQSAAAYSANRNETSRRVR